MADYVVTGRVLHVPDRYEHPWNLVENTPMGGTITATLSSQDEAAMFNHGLLITQDAAAGHLYPR
jgi:hypothetical protein